MTSEAQRLADLERRVTRLERTLRPAPPAEPPRQVSITHPAETNSQFIMPTDEELLALHRA